VLRINNVLILINNVLILINNNNNIKDIIEIDDNNDNSLFVMGCTQYLDPAREHRYLVLIGLSSGVTYRILYIPP